MTTDDIDAGTHAGLSIDTNGQAFRHIVAGMHIGRMNPIPQAGVFDAVLTVGLEPGTVDDTVRHRHIPIPYVKVEGFPIADSADWAVRQVDGNRKLLIRSEGGRQRPGLVVALAILRLGGSYYDALTTLHHAAPDALTDFRYLDVLRRVEEAMVAFRRAGGRR